MPRSERDSGTVTSGIVVSIGIVMSESSELAIAFWRRVRNSSRRMDFPNLALPSKR